MFRGSTPINLDAKGRMAMPTRYRDALMAMCDGQLVVTIDIDDRDLLLYPRPAWEEIQAQLDRLPNVTGGARRIQRLLTGHAMDVEMDGNGRLLLPAVLREFARLEKRIMLIGQGRKFEIWSEELWNQRREEWLASAADEASEATDALAALSL